MDIISNVPPEQIDLIYFGDMVLVKLNKDIKQNEIKSKIDVTKYVTNSDGEIIPVITPVETTVIEYSYNQVSFKIEDRPNLKKTILDNFDLYFEYGLKLLVEEVNEKELQIKLDSLLNGGIIETNNITTSQIMNILMENMKLKNTNKTLIDQLVSMSMDLMKIKMKLGVK